MRREITAGKCPNNKLTRPVYCGSEKKPVVSSSELTVGRLVRSNLSLEWSACQRRVVDKRRRRTDMRLCDSETTCVRFFVG